MTNFLLRLRTDNIIYFFFCPMVLVFIVLFFVKTDSKLEISVVLLLFGLWLQGFLFLFFTYNIVKVLILQESHKYRCITGTVYMAHSLLNFILFTAATYIVINSIIVGNYDNMAPLIYLIALISEIFRARSFSKLLVSIEFGRETRFKDYVFTWYLAINPLIGIWSLHYRILNLMNSKVGGMQIR